MNKKYQYTFPEKDVFRAMETTEPEFDIFESGRENLYVHLQELRSPKQFTRIKKDLGITGDELTHLPNDYIKILFSGHRGCGKTVELLRFHESINTPRQYFSVFVSLQEEIEILKMQPEDLFIILINKLLRTLREHNVPYNKKEFEDIAHAWLQDKEVEKELNYNYGAEAGVEAKAGWNFWDIFSAEGFIKSKYGYQNSTTTKIREAIRRDTPGLVGQLRTALVGVRDAIERHGKGRDLIFIVDDFEKARPEIYNAIFLTDPQFTQNLNAHLICCVPIQTYYNVQEQAAAAELFKFSYLPMIHIDEDEDCEAFCNIVTRRVDKRLFDNNVLKMITKMSGGSPRQLLRLVNQCLLDTDETVTTEIAKSTFKRLAVERLRPLTDSHRKLLESRNFEGISPELLDLLFALNVFEYNGDDIVRRINPLLEDFFPKSDEKA
jgi:hypothetical protein